MAETMCRRQTGAHNAVILGCNAAPMSILEQDRNMPISAINEPIGKLGPESGVLVSLRMLILIRWVAIAGQIVALLAVPFLLGFDLPIVLTLGVVGASVLLNIAAIALRGLGARLGDFEASLYLAYDIVQLGALLYLTGGLANPFAILMIAPVTVAATILSRRSVIGLSFLTLIAISVIAVLHLKLPWTEPTPEFPLLYTMGTWVALVCATLFIAGYIWSVAEEARRMQGAFAATQLALAREQRISAVGALAAAAAHQLGSPLATIAVVAKELARDLPKGSPHGEDAALLLSQSERCRTILADLAQQRDSESGSPYTQLPVSALVEAAGEPYEGSRVRVFYTTGYSGDGPGGGAKTSAEPLVRRSPEVMHGLGNLIQNAVQFAHRDVVVTTFWNADRISVEVADDGPGFPPPVLARIGDPYISGRGGETQHMGLGIFIAQSLLERTGADLAFTNVGDGGAQVVVTWQRSALESRPTEPSPQKAGT